MSPFLSELPATPALAMPASALPETGAGGIGTGLDFAALLGAAALPPPPAPPHGTKAESRSLPGAASLPLTAAPQQAPPVFPPVRGAQPPAPLADAAARLPDGGILPDAGEILPLPRAPALLAAPYAGAVPDPQPAPATTTTPAPVPAPEPTGTLAAPGSITVEAPRQPEPAEPAEPASLPASGEPGSASVLPPLAPPPPLLSPLLPPPPALPLAAVMPAFAEDAPLPARASLLRGPVPRAAAGAAAAPAVPPATAPAAPVPPMLPAVAPMPVEESPDALSAPAAANASAGGALPVTPAPVTPQAASAPQPAADLRPPEASAPMETAIAQAGTLREALRAQRPEMVVRHAEFGMIALRLEPAAPDQWRAVLASRDPGFVPAIQAALAERALAPLPAAADSGSATSQNGAGEQRYGSTPNGGQGSSQPYLGQSDGRDGEAAPDHRRPSTAAALAARAGGAEEDSTGASEAPGGLFA
jgi:hypothetical protein